MQQSMYEVSCVVRHRQSPRPLLQLITNQTL